MLVEVPRLSVDLQDGGPGPAPLADAESQVVNEVGRAIRRATQRRDRVDQRADEGRWRFAQGQLAEPARWLRRAYEGPARRPG